jgi:general secretion pathway protein K
MSFYRYSANLKPFAKKLRSNMTLAEVLLWKRINRSQLGVRFIRQKPIGEWVVDFYCKKLQLAIEVDGDSHNLKQDRDKARQRKLEAMGVRFLRFWDYEVKNDIRSVIDRIEIWIEENPPRPASRATPPLEGIEEDSPPRETGRGGSRRGAALVAVMWVLVIVSMIISSFAFEMQLEARILSAQRKRLKADQLALAGIELARALIDFEQEDPAAEKVLYEEPYKNKAVQLADGAPIDYSEVLGDGIVELRIDFERGRRNVREMSDDEWRELFEQAGVPNVEWDTLLSCLTDWEDEDELTSLNGAESDDPFYRERGYECKNAPIDTVDELLLIKEWTEEILYGTPPDAETPISGIADQLTVWGDGKINPNSASREVLYSLGLAEDVIEAILELRMGPDGEAGTEDDGLDQNDLAAIGLNSDLFTLVPEYISVTSVGRVGDLESRISAIFQRSGRELKSLFWVEGNAGSGLPGSRHP